MVRNDEEKWETLALKAQALARDGEIDEAIQLVFEIPLPLGFAGWSHERTLALISIALKLAEQGQFERALSIAHEAIRSCEALHEGAIWEEADCYAEIALLLERLNARQDAMAIWRKAISAAQRSQSLDIDCVKILARIARNLADVGEVQFACDVARSIRLEEIRIQTLAYVRSMQR